MALRRRVAVAVFATLAVASVIASAAGSDLSIRRISPSGDNVPAGQEIVFQFDRAMVALGNMARSPAAVPITIAPAVGCEWRWLDTTELACRLRGKATLRPATRYRITVGTDLQALDGSRLAHPVTSEFTTILPQVEWTMFQRWASPVLPEYLMRFNLPVTAGSVAAHVSFAEKVGGSVRAEALPYNREREGPVWLPVPDMPGLLIEIENPQPATPLNARNAAGEARLQWLVRPAQPLEEATDYDLELAPGLDTPLGTLSGKGGLPGDTHLETWGPFRFRGISCDDNSDKTLSVAPQEAQRLPCEPTSVSLAFSAPVPLSTLAAAEWKPEPRPAREMERKWQDYPAWYLGIPQDPMAAAQRQLFRLPFDLQPTSEYEITIPAGVEDAFGRRLAEAGTVRVRTGHYAPFLNGPPDEAVLEAKVPTIVPLRFTNLDMLEFRYRRLFAKDLGRIVPPLRRPPAASTSILARPGLRVREDRIMTAPLGLRQALGGHAGVAWGKIFWAPVPGSRRIASQDFFGEVTPWQVFAKVGYFDTLVWVSSLATGRPVMGARVALYAGHPESLDRLGRLGSSPEKTDVEGLAVLPGTLGFSGDWFKPWEDGALHYYVGVTEGDKFALLPLDWSFQRYIGAASDYDLYENNAPAWGHLHAWAVTQQGIYRPASEVRLALFVRDVSNASLVAPPALDYRLRIADPTGNDVLDQKHVKLDRYGGFATALHLPKSAPMGWYSIELSWPTGTERQSREIGRFLVTEFVPASFKVSATLEGSRFGPGETVGASARARLHAGGPYTDADIKFTATIEAEEFAPDTPVAAGFSFDANPEQAPSSLAVASTQTRLNHQGEATTEFALPADPAIHYGQLALEAAVKSERGTWVANRTSAQFAARDRFIGLRLNDWLLTAASPAKVQYLVVDPNGKPAAGAPVHLVLQREVVTSARVENAAGYFTPNEQTAWRDEDSCRAVSGTAAGTCLLTPRHAGAYRILAEVRDTQGRVQTTTLESWATGPGVVVWSQEKRVGLVPDKSEYHPGDTAHVLVQNPFPGAIALVTVERYGVLWKETIPLSGSTPVLDVPIEASFFPGAYLSVAVFSPRVERPDSPDLGRPELALGYVALPVSGSGSSLAVRVAPDARVYKPGETVHVDVRVRAEDGKASAGTRLVAVVLDQGVLDLLSEGRGYFDPRKRFYAPPAGPDMENFSLAEQLLTELQPKTGKGESPGGGGGAGPDIRTIFKYSAYWNAGLETGVNGKTAFSFVLPDNLTRWRIFVIAMTPAAAMGLGDASLRVNLPIQIQPALPNEVHVGDRFAAGFDVTNRTPAKREIETVIKAKGNAIDGQPSARDRFSLASFAHRPAWLELAAQAPGSIHLTAAATSGTLGDAMAADIPVRRALAPITAAEYGNTIGKKIAVPVKLPPNAVPGATTLSVTLAPTLVGGLGNAFAALRDDPLDSWEIRLSRAVLASDYLALQPLLGNSVRWDDARADIGRTLQSAADFQAPDGGMAFWIPRDDFVSPYLSVYTALAFDWLARAGHAVPETVQNRLRGYLRDHILAMNDADSAAAPVLRAGALAALATTGKLPAGVVAGMIPELPKPGKLPAGVVAGMIPELPKLRLFGQALLLQAAIEVKDQKSAAIIAQSILSHAEESAGEISFNERIPGAYLDLLATPLRSNCAVLDSLVKYAATRDGVGLVGTTPQKLLRWIIAARGESGAWPNSQENVFCSTATLHYAAAYETPVKDLAVSVTAAGKTLGHAEFASRRSPARTIAAAAPATAASFDVTVAPSGSGRLYYNVNLTYALPPEAVKAADAGFTLRRKYRVERDGKWEPVTANTTLTRGDVLRVDLYLDVPTERHHVVLEDPLPGAFEAVNRNLATAMLSTPAAQPDNAVLWFDYGAWPNGTVTTSGFYHRETGFDAVRFFADNLMAGDYHLIYAVQVITPGRFIAPAPTVREIYQPDVFGRGEAQSIRVALPKQ